MVSPEVFTGEMPPTGDCGPLGSTATSWDVLPPLAGSKTSWVEKRLPSGSFTIPLEPFWKGVLSIDWSEYGLYAATIESNEASDKSSPSSPRPRASL